ncbi:MAG: TonB-dependent receptor [Candidatus Didemnitutus sp.]|nr:TonB-dependent receptor [Candidatus Didemnitutus sp.]
MRTLGHLLRAVLLGALISVAALAADEARKHYDIPAGDAAAALKQFSSVSGRETLFAAAVVRGVKTSSVKGELTVREALDALLDGTGLLATTDTKTGAIAVRRETPAEAKNAVRAIEENSDRPDSKPRLATDANGENILQLDTFEVFGSKLINLDKPRSRDDVQPYVVFDHNQIQNSQATTLQDFFLTRLPMATDLGSSAQNLSAPTSSINLRGLGTNQTLILVDGRRLPSRTTGNSAMLQPDVNGIPLAMIERIEILPSTASAIYGGGATGGVVNIITRKDFSGVILDLNYVNTFDTDSAQRRADLTATFNLRGGATVVTVTGSYAESNDLLQQDRDFTVHARRLAYANNPGTFNSTFFPPAGATTNVRGFSGSNLQLKPEYGGTVLSSTFTSLPIGYAGVSSADAAALVANAGRYNLDIPEDLSARQAALITTPIIKSLGLSLRQKITPWLEGYGDYLRTQNRGNGATLLGPNSSTLAVTAPNNPFTTAVNVTYPAVILRTPGFSTLNTTRITGGLVARLPGEWQAALDYTWGRSLFVNRRTAPVLGDPDGPSGPSPSYLTAVSTGVLDVLRDLKTYPLNYTPYLLPGLDADNNGDLVSQTGALRASGPVFHLPAGDIILSASVEGQRENKESSVFPLASTSGTGFLYSWFPAVSSTARAFYTEARVPLIAAAEKSQPSRLELQTSVRYDTSRYHTLANALSLSVPSSAGPFPAVDFLDRKVGDTSYLVGLRTAPWRDLTLRASWGTGFLAPSLSQMSPNPVGFGSFSVTDPKRGNSTSFIAVDTTSGGNPGLKPEHSRSLSAGAIFTPRWLPGFRLSVDFTKINKTDEIRSLSGQTAIDLEDQLPAGRVVRDALTPAEQALGYTGGAITALDISLYNFTRREVTAVDFQADYLRKTTLGEFRPYAIATWMGRSASQTTTAQPLVNTIGFTDGPLKWRGNGGLDWSRGPWSAGWNVQYYDAQFIYPRSASVATRNTSVLTQGGERFPRQFYHDVQVRYQFGSSRHRWGGWLLSDLQISVGLQNALDKEPPIVATTGTVGGYQFTTDPRLRRYTLHLQKRF